MKKTFYVGSVLGIPININYTWLVIFGLVVWTLATGEFPAALPGQANIIYWSMAMISAVLFFGSLLMHELSHSVVALRNKLPIRDITLFIFGGVAHMEKEPQDPRTELKMAIAGPLASVFLSATFFVLTYIFNVMRAPAPVLTITFLLFSLNAAVAVFNLVPGFPLDGGRVLRAALWWYLRDLKRATRIASNCGKIFAYILMGLGLFNLFGGAFVSGVWLIFIGLFLFEAAEQGYQQLAMKRALTGVYVRDIMSRNVVTIKAKETLDKLVNDDFFKYRFTSFPVITDDDTLAGLLTLHNVKDVPREKWAQTTAEQAMTPLSSKIIIAPHVEIMPALSKMVSSGIGRLIVIEDHSIIGIISQRDVMRLFEVRTDLES